jgi:hypothetical protein
MKTDVKVLQDHLREFLDNTIEARELSERDRDYRDNKQWSAAELSRLNARKQAPIIDNRLKPKVEGLKGLYIQRAADPKAYARNKADEKASEVVTDGLRYVSDSSDFANTKLDVFENLVVEGYGGVIVEIKETKRGVDITPNLIPWDRIYFDPYSRKADFSDARYMGIVLWQDVETAKQTFNKKEAEIDESVNVSEVGDTFEDRPTFGMVSADRKRVMIAQEYYLQDGKWHCATFCGNSYLVEPALSPYLDDDGEPCNPIELVGAYIDRENNRFGEVRYFIDQQDEINKRRSKFLHLLSARQTFSRRGAKQDIANLKRELASPDGHVEFEGQKWGDDFGIIPTGDMGTAQFQLYLDAKASLDSVSFNAQMSGERQGNLSGVAVSNLQSAGMLETNPLFLSITSWEKRVYRQCWYRMKQYWTQEKWIRVTDNFDKLRYIGINVPITLSQQMQDMINDESLPSVQRQQVAVIFTQMMQAQDPRLQSVVETKNAIPELDMDIMLDLGQNSINVQQEQFRMLLELAQARPEIPLTAVLELSELRGKDELIKEIKEGQQAAQQAQAQVAQVDAVERQVNIEGKQIQNQLNAAKIAETGATTDTKRMEAITKQIENLNLAARPDPTPQVNV